MKHQPVVSGENFRISVILPTYNRAHTLKRALRSILNQSYQNLEVIIVDDASTDNTSDIVQSFKDHRIEYIRLESRRGANAARNIGINSATGEYIAFQDSDDEWLSEKLERQMEHFLNAPAHIGVIYTDFIRIKEGRAIYFPSTKIQKSGNLLDQLLVCNHIANPSVIIKKECFDRVGVFDENLPRLQDWELFIRIAKEYEFINIPDPYVIVYHTDDSITSQHNLLHLGLEKIYLKHATVFNSHKRQGPIFRSLGLLQSKASDTKNGIHWLKKAIRCNPLDWMAWVYLITAFFGGKFFALMYTLMKKFRLSN